MEYVLLDQPHHTRKLAVMVALTTGVCLVGLDGRTLGQAHAATAFASATVIAPVNIPDSPADLPAAVSNFGSWIRVVTPLAQWPSPVLSASWGGRSAGASAAASPCFDLHFRTLECLHQLTASNGTVQGSIVSALLLHAPKAGIAGGRYRVTVAFN